MNLHILKKDMSHVTDAERSLAYDFLLPAMFLGLQMFECPESTATTVNAVRLHWAEKAGSRSGHSGHRLHPLREYLVICAMKQPRTK